MTKIEEQNILEEIKESITNFFDQVPPVAIYEARHLYLTIEWRFILTFTEQGKLFLSFNVESDPLLAAKITQCLSGSNFQFDMGRNFYYSPFDKVVYYDSNQIEKKRNEDRMRQIIMPELTKVYQ